MNQTVDPCDDFYDYACGRFITEVEIPSKDGMLLPSITSTLNKVQAELVALIVEPIGSTDAKPIVMAKKYFADCMDEAARESVGATPLLELIDRIGGWPLLGKEKEGAVIGKWWQLADSFASAGVTGDFLVNVQVEEDLRQPHRRVIYVRKAIHEGIPGTVK